MGESFEGRHSRGAGNWIAAVLVVVGCLAGGIASASAQQVERAPWATGDSAPEALEVEMAVFGPGDAVATWFGHVALVVRDTEHDESRLYNYGMFSFDGTLLVKFAAGRLWFWVGQAPPKATYRLYERADRDIRLYDLNLEPSDRMRLARFLAWNVQRENRHYLYHHYRDNCSTRPRDIVDASVRGQLEEATAEPSGMTLREHTRRYTHRYFWMDLLLMFMMNDNIDRPIQKWDAMFLPEELEEEARELTYTTPSGDTRPLLENRRVLHESGRTPAPDERAPPGWPWALGYALLGVLGAFGTVEIWRRTRGRAGRWATGLYHAFVGGIWMGVPGMALYVMSLATDHRVTFWNENLFFANPITFAALPLGAMLAWGKTWTEGWLRWSWTALVASGTVGILLKPLPGFDQVNFYPICFVFPLTAGLAGSLWWKRWAETRE